MSLLIVSNISKKNNDLFSVNEVSFKQELNEKIAIIGESGSGKSTLLKIIGGYLQPDYGEVFFNDEKILGSYEQLIPGHKQMGYLSQHFELRNNYRVDDYLDYGSEMTKAEAHEIFDLCRITHLLHRKTNDGLSGGEKQRIALAKLLLKKPQFLLLDEPFSNLDIAHKNIIKNVIADLQTKLEITCLLISHDPLDVLSWANKIIVMHSGKIVQTGSPKQVYSQPASTYIAALFGSYNLIDPSLITSLKPFPALDHSKKKLFVRPENVLISKNKTEGISGIIQGFFFMGNHYKVIIKINDVLVESITSTNQFQTGEQVAVSLTESDFWFI